MKDFILTMGLYTEEELNSRGFSAFYEECWRHRPDNYDVAAYVTRISDITGYNSRRPPSYNSIIIPIRRFVHRLIALSNKARHSAQEKVIVDDLFLLEGMDRGNFIDVPWYLAKFLSDGAKGAQAKSKIQGAHFIGRLARNLGLMTPEKLAWVTIDASTALIGLNKLFKCNICRPNGLGGADLMPEGAFGGSAGTSGSGGASSSQAGTSQAYEEEAVRARPTMTTMDRFRVIEGSLGHIDTGMMEVRDYVDDMASGIFGMSDQFDGFQSDMRRMQDE